MREVEGVTSDFPKVVTVRFFLHINYSQKAKRKVVWVTVLDVLRITVKRKC